MDSGAQVVSNIVEIGKEKKRAIYPIQFDPWQYSAFNGRYNVFICNYYYGIMF